MGKATVILAVLLLVGCVPSIEAPVEDPRQVWCEHNDPRRDATPDTPRPELDEINAHNLKGMRWCGWEPETE